MSGAPALPCTPAPTGPSVSVIGFDAQGLHEVQEAEIQQEENVRQNELCELLTHEFDADFSDEESVLSHSEHLDSNGSGVEKTTTTVDKSSSVTVAPPSCLPVNGDLASTPTTPAATPTCQSNQAVNQTPSSTYANHLTINAQNYYSSTPKSYKFQPKLSHLTGQPDECNPRFAPYSEGLPPSGYNGATPHKQPNYMDPAKSEHINGNPAAYPQGEFAVANTHFSAVGAGGDTSAPSNGPPYYDGAHTPHGRRINFPPLFNFSPIPIKGSKKGHHDPHDLQSESYPHNDLQPEQYPHNDLQTEQYPHNDLQTEQYPHNDLQTEQYPHNDLQPEQYPHNDLQTEQYPHNDLQNEQYPHNDLQPEPYPHNDLQTDPYPHTDLQNDSYPQYRPEEIPPDTHQPGSIQQNEEIAGVDQRQHDQLTALYNARGLTLDDLKAQLESAQSSLAEERRINTHRLKLKAKELSATTEETERHRRHLDVVSSQLEANEIASESLRSRLKQEMDDKNELISQLSSIEKANSDLKFELAAFSDGSLISSTRNQHNEQIESLKLKHSEELLAVKQSLDLLTRESRQYSEDASKYREIVSELRAKIEKDELDRADTVSRLTENLKVVQYNLQEQMKNSDDSGKLRNLHGQVQELSAARDLSNDLNSALQDEINDLKQEVCMYESSLSLLRKNNVTSINDSYNELNIDTRENKDDTEQVKQLKLSLTTSLNRYKSKCNSLEKCDQELSEKTSLVKSLQSKLSLGQAMLPYSSQENNNNSKTISNLEDQLKTEKEYSTKLNQDILNLIDKQKVDLQASIDRCQKTADQHLLAVVDQTRLEAQQQFQSEVDLLKSNFDKLTIANSSHTESTEKELYDVKKTYMDMCQLKDLIQAQFLSLQETHAQEKDKAEEVILERIKQALSDQVVKTDEMCSLNTTQSDRVATLTRELSTLTSSLASKDARIASLEDDQRYQDQRLEDQLKMAAQKSETATEQLRKELVSSKNQATAFEGEATSLRKDVETYKLAAEESKMAADNAQASKMAALASSTTSSSETDAQLVKLKSVNKDLLKVGVELREKIGQLITELASVKSSNEKVKMELNAEIKEVTKTGQMLQTTIFTKDAHIENLIQESRQKQDKLNSQMQSDKKNWIEIELPRRIQEEITRLKKENILQDFTDKTSNDSYSTIIDDLEKKIKLLNIENTECRETFETEKHELIVNHNELIKQVKRESDSFHVAFIDHHKIAYTNLRAENKSKMDANREQYTKTVEALKISHAEEINNIKKEFQKNSSSITSISDAEKKSRLEYKEKHSKEIEKIKNDYHEKITKHSEQKILEVDNLKNEIKIMKKANAEYVKEIKNLQVKINLEKKNDKDDPVIKKLMEKNVQLEKTIAYTERKSQKMKNLLTEQEKNKRDSQTLIAELTSNLKKYRKQVVFTSKKRDQQRSRSCQTTPLKPSDKVVHDDYVKLINEIKHELIDHMKKAKATTEEQIRLEMTSECRNIAKKMQNYHINSLNDLLNEDYSSENYEMLRSAIDRASRSGATTPHNEYDNSRTMHRAKSLTNLLDKSVERINDSLRASIKSDCQTAPWDSHATVDASASSVRLSNRLSQSRSQENISRGLSSTSSSYYRPRDPLNHGGSFVEPLRFAESTSRFTDSKKNSASIPSLISMTSTPKRKSNVKLFHIDNLEI